MTIISPSNLLAATGIRPAGVDANASFANTLFEGARAAASVDGALAPSVKSLSAILVGALGDGGNRVGSAQFEAAMLDFAREAKAMMIGNPDLGSAAARAIVDQAIEAGAVKSAALPDVGLTRIDFATTLFAEAARTLSATPTTPLYDSGVR